MLLWVANVDRQTEVAIHQRDETIDQVGDILERPRLLTFSIYLLHRPQNGNHLLFVQLQTRSQCRKYGAAIICLLVL